MIRDGDVNLRGTGRKAVHIQRGLEAENASGKTNTGLNELGDFHPVAGVQLGAKLLHNPLEMIEPGVGEPFALEITPPQHASLGRKALYDLDRLPHSTPHTYLRQDMHSTRTP